MKEFSRFFHARSDSNTDEIRAYVFGLMQAKSGAKNLEHMEEQVAGFNYQSVHNTISHAPWEHRPLMDEIAHSADGLFGGGPRCRLVVDDTGFSKKGNHSLGVARQYIGRLGKIANCQIAVCTSLASGQQSTLTDVRLYLPEILGQRSRALRKSRHARARPAVPNQTRTRPTKHPPPAPTRHSFRLREHGQRLKVRDNDQGWVEGSYLAERVWVTEGDLQKSWWLLVWENPDERTNNGSKPKAPRRHYALSNAPVDEDPRRLVIDGVGRNVVECHFRDGKSEVGMADYQIRATRPPLWPDEEPPK